MGYPASIKVLLRKWQEIMFKTSFLKVIRFLTVRIKCHQGKKFPDPVLLEAPFREQRCYFRALNYITTSLVYTAGKQQALLKCFIGQRHLVTIISGS